MHAMPTCSKGPAAAVLPSSRLTRVGSANIVLALVLALGHVQAGVVRKCRAKMANLCALVDDAVPPRLMCSAAQCCSECKGTA